MEKKEQDIKNIIDDKTKDVSVPETLQPEQIEKMLQRENVKNKQRNKKIYRTVEILAACAVFAVGIYAYGNLKKQPEGKTSLQKSVKAIRLQVHRAMMRFIHI